MSKYRASTEVLGKVLKLFLESPKKSLSFRDISPELADISESSIRRALQCLGDEEILGISRPRGRQKGTDKSLDYKINMKPRIFEKIFKISVDRGIDDLFRSRYAEHFIRLNGFGCVFAAIKEKLNNPEIYRKASFELFALKSTHDDYADLRDLAIEYYKTYKKFDPFNIYDNSQEQFDNRTLEDIITERPEHHFFDKRMTDLANKVGLNIRPIRSKRIELLTKFDPKSTVPFYRNTIHKKISNLFSDLNREKLITSGLAEFMKYDNYLSPFTSYPTNVPEVLLFSDSFKRVYSDFYLMNKLDLKKVYERALTVYSRFADLLFEHFRNDPPLQHSLELWTKQFIFQWNLSAQNFDIVWNYLDKLYGYELGSGKYHVYAAGLILNVIDLETNEFVHDYQEIISKDEEIWEPIEPIILHHLFAGLETDVYDPYTNLISCYCFRDPEECPAVLSYEKIKSRLISKFVKRGWDYYM
jgi:hypothetical protein